MKDLTLEVLRELENAAISAMCGRTVVSTDTKARDNFIYCYDKVTHTVKIVGIGNTEA
jgi:hypothetical protein